MNKQDELSKKKKYVELLEAYGSLLNEREVERMKIHYYDDYSISEIAERDGISRNAVFLSLEGAEKKLDDFESKLHLISRRNKVKSIIDKISSEDNENELNRIKEIIDNGIWESYR